MKKLNKSATRIFCQLLAQLKGQSSTQLTAGGFMPLFIEKIDDNIHTPTGTADHYSLMHAHKQNDDLMRDPEMTFLVVDKREHPKDYTAIAIYPVSYRQDSDGIDFESVRIDNKEVTNFIPVWQSEHCRFANQWMTALHQQGFIQ